MQLRDVVDLEGLCDEDCQWEAEQHHCDTDEGQEDASQVDYHVEEDKTDGEDRL